MRRMSEAVRKHQRAGWLRPFLRLGRYLLVVVLGYLEQGCIMPYVRIDGVTPSLLFAIIGIVTVCYGRLRAYWTGAIYGIVLEIMKPSITLMNLMLYPIAAAFCSVFFADKSDKRLEAERSLNKAARNGNVYLRTVLCAGMNTLLYEIVNVTYIYLGGTFLTGQHFYRAGIDLAGTMLLTVVLMVPLRRFLGFKAPPREEKESKGRYL